MICFCCRRHFATLTIVDMKSLSEWLVSFWPHWVAPAWVTVSGILAMWHWNLFNSSNAALKMTMRVAYSITIGTKKVNQKPNLDANSPAGSDAHEKGNSFEVVERKRINLCAFRSFSTNPRSGISNVLWHSWLTQKINVGICCGIFVFCEPTVTYENGMRNPWFFYIHIEIQ